MIKSKIVDNEIKYDGTQLRSHYAYMEHGLNGDSIVAFAGPCDVSITEMVDLEDVKQNQFIKSDNMLHFIIEHFDCDLNLMIARQRLFIDCLIQELHDSLDEIRLDRNGDDVFDDGKKLTVSIATASPVSHLIHTGINISSKNTPVPTKGLEDYGINWQATAMGTMNRYKHEISSMAKARAKVRATR